MSSLYRVSVKALIRDKAGKILLAREESGLWDLLGGGIKQGESPKDCLEHEIKEETGLLCRIISKEPKTFFLSKTSKGVPSAVIVYGVELNIKDFITLQECQELRFFSMLDLNKLELSHYVVDLQKYYLHK